MLEGLAKDRAAFLVARSYKEAIYRRYKAFRQPTLTSEKSKHNATEFVAVAKHRSMSIDDLMREALDMYSEDWCNSAFKQLWPPIGIVIGEKCRTRLSRVITHVKITKGNKEKYVKKYLELLSPMPRVDAIKAVEAGWPEGPMWIRSEMLRRLRDGERTAR